MVAIINNIIFNAQAAFCFSDSFLENLFKIILSQWILSEVIFLNTKIKICWVMGTCSLILRIISYSCNVLIYNLIDLMTQVFKHLELIYS